MNPLLKYEICVRTVNSRYRYIGLFRSSVYATMDAIKRVGEICSITVRVVGAMSTIHKIDRIAPVVADKVFIETQYAKATNALCVLIEKEGCCNAIKPFIDALNDISQKSDTHEANKDFVRRVLDIASGVIDIDLNTTTKSDRLDRLNIAIKFLTILRGRYET